MKVIAKHSLGKKIVGDTLQISVDAKECKLKHPETIDATIGTFSNEDKSFLKYHTVDKILKELSDVDYFSYSSVDGGKLYHDAVTTWTFQEHRDKILSSLHCKVVATPGGTGAVSNSVFCSLDEGETLILPDIYWGPYKGIASSNSIETNEYNFLVDDKFNLNGFIELANKVIKKQGKIVTILNDPNNNPTGYSLSEEEFSNFLIYLNNCGVEVSLILDIAYLDYSVKNFESTRKKLSFLTKINNNVLVTVAFSCSKTFSIYGLRTGAQIILGKDGNVVHSFYDASVYLSRSRWSNISKAGINMLSKLVLNNDNKNEFIKELNENVSILTKRAELFIKEANECDLPIYPYFGGFFVTIICEDGHKLFEALKSKYIFVIPYPKAIRISISALSIDEIKGLAFKILKVKEAL